MKNISALLFCFLAGITQVAFSQNNQVPLSQIKDSLTKSSASHKKNLLSFGINYGTTIGGNGFGVTAKLERLIKPKLGIGFTVIAGGYFNPKWTVAPTDSSVGYTTKSKSLSIGLLSDFTLTYYIFGKCESKAAMYTDIGLGYQLTKGNNNYQYSIYQGITYPVINSRYILSGLSAHISLGGANKLGKGKIFYELACSPVLLGVFRQTISTPANYPANAPADDPPGSGEGSFKKSGLFPYRDSPILSLGVFNLGYCIYF